MDPRSVSLLMDFLFLGGFSLILLALMWLEKLLHWRYRRKHAHKHAH